VPQVVSKGYIQSCSQVPALVSGSNRAPAGSCPGPSYTRTPHPAKTGSITAGDDIEPTAAGWPADFGRTASLVTGAAGRTRIVKSAPRAAQAVAPGAVGLPAPASDSPNDRSCRRRSADVRLVGGNTAHTGQERSPRAKQCSRDHADRISFRRRRLRIRGAARIERGQQAAAYASAQVRQYAAT
jgi:hypothetical protein